MNLAYNCNTQNIDGFIAGGDIASFERATKIVHKDGVTFLFEHVSQGINTRGIHIEQFLAADKEALYVNALKNMFRKLDFMELSQALENDEISEEEFDKELEDNEAKYLIPYSDKKPTLRQVLQISNIINRIDKVDDLSVEDVSELFSLDLSESERLLDAEEKQQLVQDNKE